MISRIACLTIAALVAVAGPAVAQLASIRVAPGDQGAQSRLLDQYEAAVTADSSSLALLVAAAAIAIDLAEFHSDVRARDSLFAQGERYARLAVAAQPDDADARFQLARALGRKALTLGVRARAKYAVEIREQALSALRSNSDHAGALHVLGLWHQHVMQLSALQRTAARLLLGAHVFGVASWMEAERNLVRAVALEPSRIVHRLDLGRLYAARKRYADAREQLEWVVTAPESDYNDPFFKREAAAALQRLK